MADADTQLKKVLKPIHLWAIAVALVISGEYFGWNYGWAVSGTLGFLYATIIVTILYITFIFSYTELTTSIPHAGGAFAYAYKAVGPIGGLIAGYATVIDFVLATPAIASSLGAYINFLHPELPVLYVALAFYLLFSVLNIIGVKESAIFSVVITILAIAELLLYLGIIAPSFKTSNFFSNGMPFGWKGIFAGLPFAVWFYLAIEGVATTAEEVRDPKRDVPKGYIAGLATLVVLALAVSILTGGITDWRKLSNIDYPLPEAIGIVLGKDNTWTKLFTSIGLFGLIASFHGTVLAYSRQIFAIARSGYLPGFLGSVGKRFKTPHAATITGSLIGIAVLLILQSTSQIIILSVLGALTMYLMSMISLFVLRKKQPDMPRPFVSPFFPVFPGIALLLSAVCMISIIYYNPLLSAYFFGGLILVLFGYVATGRHKRPISDDLLKETLA
ncbi:ethanolamine permease [Mucilaginibacter myungsuensis]|uniref:Ethanolamine permease n=1 Tax=Mucilaginibacter myungsuensis TaxID=649104 RepID=A0A929PXW0_9SPHI|nr:ethanolamine permease [Mucilaginibacter myungsuensis]MBE9663544.1 ethanolamine permease [Mucilaginibacter myungsuensis]MDN3600282.1 ethanolamine permease [Mucilaginibacter myungsuensis]